MLNEDKCNNFSQAYHNIYLLQVWKILKVSSLSFCAFDFFHYTGTFLLYVASLKNALFTLALGIRITNSILSNPSYKYFLFCRSPCYIGCWLTLTRVEFVSVYLSDPECLQVAFEIMFLSVIQPELKYLPDYLVAVFLLVSTDVGNSRANFCWVEQSRKPMISIWNCVSLLAI